jgi:hypothetical protein
MKANAWLLLTLASIALPVGASELASLIDLPVTGSVAVPPAQLRDASARAASKGSPVDIALAVAGAFEGKQQLIVQTNAGAEAPSAARVTVVRDGLLDDAVRNERWDIDLARAAAGAWQIRKVGKSWRCWRGTPTAGFTAQPCP